MFRRTAWIIGVIAGFLFIVGLQSADAEHRGHRHIRSTSGGTYLDLPNFSPNGGTAIWATGQGSNTLGTYISQGVSQPVYQGEDPKCPGGLLIIDAQGGSGFGFSTETYSNGDQIYYQVRTRTECLDDQNGFTGSDTGDIVGGTGRFAGVSGTYESSFAGVRQFLNTPQEFGSFTGEATGILVFPHER